MNKKDNNDDLEIWPEGAKDFFDDENDIPEELNKDYDSEDIYPEGLDLVDIGFRIKRIRKFRKLTQKELGLALGFDPSNASVRIAQYESSTRVPKIDNALIIADVLDCDVEHLYAGYNGALTEYLLFLMWHEELFEDSVKLFDIKADPYNKIDTPIKAEINLNEIRYQEKSENYPSVFIDNTSFNYRLNYWLKLKTLYNENILSHDKYFESKLRFFSTSKLPPKALKRKGDVIYLDRDENNQ